MKCEIKYCPVCLRLGPGLPALRPGESRRGLWDHHRNLPTGQRRVCCCQVPQKPMWVMKPTVSIQTVTTVCWFQCVTFSVWKTLNVLWFIWNRRSLPEVHVHVRLWDGETERFHQHQVLSEGLLQHLWLTGRCYISAGLIKQYK